MRSATLTLTVDFVQAIDAKNLAGHGRFNNGKMLDSISFTAYAPRLRDTIVPDVIPIYSIRVTDVERVGKR